MFSKVRFSKIRFFVISIAAIFLSARNAEAFFSAGTLVILGATLAGFMKQFIIILIAFLISLFVHQKKTKKENKKKVFLALVAVFFVVTLGLFSYYFLQVRNLNDDDIDEKSSQIYQLNTNFSVFLEDDNASFNISDTEMEACIQIFEEYKTKEDLDKAIEKQRECIYKKSFEKGFEDFRNSRFIDLNEISLAEYGKFDVYGINYEERISLLDSRPFPDYISILGNPDRIDETFSDEPRSKKLIYCYGGSSADILAYLAYLKGYDSYYTNLAYTKNPVILESELLTEVADENAVIILPANMRSNKKDVILHFKGSKSVIEEFRSETPGVEIFDYEYDDKMSDSLKKKIEGSNILCYGDLNCLLTKHLLYTFSLDVDVIYQISD